jgi:endonuclease/exonuclease/phosphatase family metal-dependent hydrolase
MKIITLNAWEGKIKKPLFDFINVNKNNVDIFCLQEIYFNAEGKEEPNPDISLNLFTEIQNLLPEYNGYFCPTLQSHYGIATFIKKEIVVQNLGNFFIYDHSADELKEGNYSSKVQWHEIEYQGQKLFITNLHGLWTGKGKNDTPARLQQSNIIKNFINSNEGLHIVMGDFNLLPDTKSISIIAEGMQDLIKIYNIKNTRTSFYTKEDKYADYIFTSPELKINDFKVLPDEVSDHAPLLVEIKI